MSLSNEDKEWLETKLQELEARLTARFGAVGLPDEMRRTTHSLAMQAMDLDRKYGDRLDKLRPPIPRQ